MSNYLDRSNTDQKSSIAAIGLVLFGLGLLVGWGIGKERTLESVTDWAVDTTHSCEASYPENGYASVADCLEQAVFDAEADQRNEMQAESYDPSR